MAESNRARAFQLFAWTVLLYHVAVIVWGAFVRATKSGAGCGEHWPLCNGTVIPPSPTLETIIEFAHRVTSGLALGLCVGLIVWAFRVFPKRHLARRAALAALFFELMEAILGAALVLTGQVAGDPSLARGVTLSVHLINTLLLIAAFTLAVWAGDKDSAPWRMGAGPWKAAFAAAGGALLVLAVSGAIAALGDTLFQSTTFREGVQRDFARGSHLFVRLRIWHPVLAAAVGAGIAWLAGAVIVKQTSEAAKRNAYLAIGLIALQWGVGAMNLALLAPVPLQLVHLALADALWICFVLMGAAVLLETGARVKPEMPAAFQARI